MPTWSDLWGIDPDWPVPEPYNPETFVGMDLTDDEYNDLMESLAEQRGRTYVRTTKVSVAQLRETVHNNREKHIAEYKEAMKKYEKERVKEIRKLAKKAEKDPHVKIDKVSMMPKPESFEDAYDTALDQLDMETRQEIELIEEEFKNLVRDKWGWSDRFAGTTSIYNHR